MKNVPKHWTIVKGAGVDKFEYTIDFKTGHETIKLWLS